VTAMKLIVLCCGLLPPSILKNRLLRLLGHAVHRTAIIKPIVILGETKIEAASSSTIGTLSVLRNVRVLLGQHSTIGQLNWISAAPFLVENSRCMSAGRLELGEHAAIMNRHYIDASGGVLLGSYSIVAGVRSTFMTHGIDVADNVLDTNSIEIGKYAMVGGNCNLVLGASVPSHSVVAMGSTVVRGLTEAHGFYAGVPAKFRKVIGGGDFFSRELGDVSPRLSRSSQDIAGPGSQGE
jgi:acetyltransferase-like isoleucine patch superfamily enzyme